MCENGGCMRERWAHAPAALVFVYPAPAVLHKKRPAVAASSRALAPNLQPGPSRSLPAVRANAAAEVLQRTNRRPFCFPTSFKSWLQSLYRVNSHETSFSCQIYLARHERQCGHIGRLCFCARCTPHRPPVPSAALSYRINATISANSCSDTPQRRRSCCAEPLSCFAGGRLLLPAARCGPVGAGRCT